jgi:hypothetical protein
MNTIPFDNLITLEEAIDRLEKCQPVYATLEGGKQDEVTAIIFGDEVHTTTSVFLLAKVLFFSSELMSQETYPFDFDDGQIEITVLPDKTNEPI